MAVLFLAWTLRLFSIEIARRVTVNHEQDTEMTMFRIEKIGEDDVTVTLTLEGKIAPPWVAVLEDECSRILRGPKRLILDFAGVNFIDRNGVAALRKMWGERVQCVNCSPFVKELLERPQTS